MKCPRCHDRGIYRDQAYCACDTGQRVLALDRLRERLLTAWTPRYIDFWIRTSNPIFDGMRPLDLVVQGRVDDVLAIVERLPGFPQGPDAPVPVATRTASETAGPAPLQTIPDPPDAVRRVLATKFRRAGQFRLANALEIGSVQDLTEDERRQLAAAVQAPTRR